MTYITKDQKEYLRVKGSRWLKREPNTAEELNYLVSALLKDYIKHKGLNYSSINDILGSLEGTKLEFHRRVVIPFNNGKLAENGDV